MVRTPEVKFVDAAIATPTGLGGAMAERGMPQAARILGKEMKSSSALVPIFATSTHTYGKK